jgi:CRP/FNR family transcriptional regulator, cyclic AMP receptor protein
VSRSSVDAQLAAYAALEARDPARMSSAWLPVLEAVPLFAGLSHRDLRRVAALARTKDYPAGTAVVRAGEPGDSFHVVLEGSARVEAIGRRTVRLRVGDFFGEMSLLDGEPRSATVSAAGELVTMSIGRAGFTKLLRDEPAVALGVLRTLAQRLRAAERSF